MEYAKIETVLKRYSFASKMQVSEHLSRFLLDGTVIDSDKISSGEVSPWEVELFAMLSIHAHEWESNEFSGNRGSRKLGEIITAIRSFIPPRLLAFKGTPELANKFLMVALQVQGASQVPIFFKIYRFSKYFSFSNTISMPGIFKAKIGCDHQKYIDIALCLWMLVF